MSIERALEAIGMAIFGLLLVGFLLFVLSVPIVGSGFATTYLIYGWIPGGATTGTVLAIFALDAFAGIEVFFLMYLVIAYLRENPE